jgi:hypothetical protein
MRVADGAKDAQTDDASSDANAKIAMPAAGFCRLGHGRKQPEDHRQYGKGPEDCTHPDCLPNLGPEIPSDPER